MTTSPMKPILKLNNISRIYHQGDASLHVLEDINLTINSGEIVALVGQSGAGKSTLLQIAGLLEYPTSGSIIMQGQKCEYLSDKERTLLRRKFLGFVYQHHHLLPEFTALENVIIPQLITGCSYTKAQDKASHLLNKLGLSQRLAHHPAKLSGGEQQRVAIARAIVNEPTLLLADEPTGNLDPRTSNDVFNILLSLAKEFKIGALIATHNLDLAKQMSRCVYLQDGKLTDHFSH